jgi:hypothetical protein
MRSLVLLTPVLLAGCFDFAGDRGRLGFVTDAKVDLVAAWTPDRSIARGTVLAVDVGEHLADGREPEAVVLTAGRTLEAGDEGWRITRAGWIQGVADGVRDHFRVRADDADALVVGPLGDAGRDAPVYAVRDDGPSAFGVGLRDARDRPLGFVPADLDLSVDGTVDWDDGLPVVTTDGPAELAVTWGDLSRTVELEPVPLDALTLTVRRVQLGDTCALLVLGEARGLPVLDPSPVRWSHTDDSAPFVPCPEEGDVSVEPRGR